MGERKGVRGQRKGERIEGGRKVDLRMQSISKKVQQGQKRISRKPKSPVRGVSCLPKLVFVFLSHLFIIRNNLWKVKLKH